MESALAMTSAWILTYLLHSTVFLTAVWMVVRLSKSFAPLFEESLWRSGLLGAFMTATAQTALPHLAVILTLGEPASFGGGGNVAGLAASGAAASPWLPGTSLWSTTGAIWVTPLMTAWMIGALFGLVRLVSATQHLHRLIAGGVPMTDHRLLRLILRLGRLLAIRPNVYCNVNPELNMPFAAGYRRPTINLPPKVQELQTAQQESLFAHEMAHIARRDPGWNLLYRLIEVFFFFQPLNRLARIRLQEIAELACDDLAVTCTGRRLDLAHCLVKVARWTGSCPGPVAAAVPSRGQITTRVRRLIETHAADEPSPRWAPYVLIVVIVAAAFSLPGITSATVPKTPPSPSVEIDAPAPPTPADVSLPRPPDPPAASAKQELTSATAPAAEPASPTPPSAPAPPSSATAVETSTEPAPTSMPSPQPAPAAAPEPKTAKDAVGAALPEKSQKIAPSSSPRPNKKAHGVQPRCGEARSRRQAEAARARARGEARAVRLQHRSLSEEQRALAAERAKVERAARRVEAKALREESRALADAQRKTAAAQRDELRSQARAAAREARERARANVENHRRELEAERRAARDQARREAARHRETEHAQGEDEAQRRPPM